MNKITANKFSEDFGNVNKRIIFYKLRLYLFNELTNNVQKYDLSNEEKNHPLDIFEQTITEAYTRLKKDITSTIIEEIAPHYKHFDKYATVLSQLEIDALCSSATRSISNSIGYLLYQRKISPDVEIKIVTNLEPLITTEKKIDVEIFLRKLQNKMFDYFQKEFNYQ